MASLRKEKKIALKQVFLWNKSDELNCTLSFLLKQEHLQTGIQFSFWRRFRSPTKDTELDLIVKIFA